MSVAAEQYEEEERIPFNRVNGLVDLYDYASYLVDSTEIVPTRPNTRSTCNSRFMYQHVYFTESLYLQTKVADKLSRDRRLSALRNNIYNQIIMRRYKEQEMHWDKVELVEPPPVAAIEDSLSDYFDIDIVGATSYSLRHLAHPAILSPWDEQNYFPKPEVEALTKRDKKLILVAERRRALETLKSPRIIPHHIVGSALKRIATHLKDISLEREASEFLGKDGFYFPLGVQKDGYYRSLGNSVLGGALGVEELDETRMHLQGLATPRDWLENETSDQGELIAA